MSVVMFFDAAPRQSELLRRIAIIAIGLSLAVAAHQIGSTLISCLRLSGPDPTACSVPEVTLPHTDTEGRDTPGQLPGISQFFMTKTASASSVTPCSDPNVKFGVR
jgi:hypothetical protein